MLRPVGSHVPLPEPAAESCLPWQGDYQTWFIGSGTQALSAAVLLAITRTAPEALLPEVILPAYGCPDLVAAVLAQGARPVLVDLLPDQPFMDAEKLARAISDDTVAIIAAGFLGVPERLSLLAGICKGRGIWLIEDSAQCFPPDCAREPIADCAVLSFGRGKPINLMGGGALLVRDDHAAMASEVLSRLPEQPLKIDWQWRARRQIFNFLLGRAGYGLLRRLPFFGLGKTVYKPVTGLHRIRLPDGLLEAGIRGAGERPSVAADYVRELNFLGPRGWTGFMDEAIAEDSGSGRVTLRYGLLAPDRTTRDRAVDALSKTGIGANGFYERVLPEIAGVSDVLVASGANYPNAESFADRLITLPSHEDVTVRDLAAIAATLGKISSAGKS